LIHNPQAALFLDGLVESGDDELMAHSSAVTYLSLLMGLKLAGYLVRQRRRMDAARATGVTSLGLGAMLHDIGVPLLDEDVRQRYMASGDEYDEQYRQHVALGYELVQGNIEPSAATVVLNHHQRCNATDYSGAGRPVLEGQRIHVFARIAGLADAFDRLRRPVNAPPRPTVYALATLLAQDVLVGFDPQVVRALLAVVPPYPPGSMVQLSDGRWAVPISHRVDDPCRPSVQIIPDPATLGGDDVPLDEQVDLTQHSPDALYVTHSDGQDVDSMNFTVPDLQRAGFVEVALA
jgi:HD-GYP domain-containing protein (c-di-GMP phosphodiesterase class II)